MSKEDLIQKIKTNPEFAKRIGSTKNLSEAFAVAKEFECSITLEELTSLNNFPGVTELSDQELSVVAGGSDEPTWGDKGSQCATCQADDQACWS